MRTREEVEKYLGDSIHNVMHSHAPEPALVETMEVLIAAIATLFADHESRLPPAQPKADGAKCDCPDDGPFRGSHCRSKRYGLPFASDDWCNCKCHESAPQEAQAAPEEHDEYCDTRQLGPDLGPSTKPCNCKRGDVGNSQQVPTFCNNLRAWFKVREPMGCLGGLEDSAIEAAREDLAEARKADAKRIAELEVWKAEAMQVMNEWEPMRAFAKRHGCKPGQSIAKFTCAKVAELEAKLAARGEALTEVEMKGIYDIWIEHQKHPSERGTIEAMRMAAEAQRKKGPK